MVRGKKPGGKTRGYGFITQDNGEDLFVYYKEIEKDKEGFKTLEEGSASASRWSPGRMASCRLSMW